MKKAVGMYLMAVVMVLMLAVPAFAGEWKQDAKGWWYQNSDGTYLVNQWEWLDGNLDGVAECYYFDGNGYLLTNTTAPDGSQVNENGAWVVNGVMQTKAVAVQKVEGSTTNSQYTVKRLSRFQDWKVEGGQMITAFDVTDVDQRNPRAEYLLKKAQNFVPDYKLFVPDGMDWPLALVQVELEGETIISITPVWIDSSNYDYGNFGDPDVYGRQEWREFEYSDPDYAAELRKQLNEEAKERAFAKYPNMIVDYSD